MNYLGASANTGNIIVEVSRKHSVLIYDIARRLERTGPMEKIICNRFFQFLYSISTLDDDDLLHMAEWFDVFCLSDEKTRDVMINDVRPSFWNIERYDKEGAE